MSRRRDRPVNLPAPYLKRIWLDTSLIDEAQEYPFCLPFLQNGFELEFEHAITIIAGAQLLRLSKYGLEPVTVEETEHFRNMREFWSTPAEFMKTMLEE